MRTRARTHTHHKHKKNTKKQTNEWCMEQSYVKQHPCLFRECVLFYLFIYFTIFLLLRVHIHRRPKLLSCTQVSLQVLTNYLHVTGKRLYVSTQKQRLKTFVAIGTRSFRDMAQTIYLLPRNPAFYTQYQGGALIDNINCLAFEDETSYMFVFNLSQRA